MNASMTCSHAVKLPRHGDKRERCLRVVVEQQHRRVVQGGAGGASCARTEAAYAGPIKPLARA
jgi:hypothetical protein